jgi:hypothetical protein
MSYKTVLGPTLYQAQPTKDVPSPVLQAALVVKVDPITLLVFDDKGALELREGCVLNATDPVRYTWTEPEKPAKAEKTEPTDKPKKVGKPDQDEPDEEKEPEGDLHEYTVAELHDLANAEEINLHGASTKDEIVKAIKKARKAK